MVLSSIPFCSRSSACVNRSFQKTAQIFITSGPSTVLLLALPLPFSFSLLSSPSHSLFSLYFSFLQTNSMPATDALCITVYALLVVTFFAAAFRCPCNGLSCFYWSFSHVASNMDDRCSYRCRRGWVRAHLHRHRHSQADTDTDTDTDTHVMRTCSASTSGLIVCYYSSDGHTKAQTAPNSHIAHVNVTQSFGWHRFVLPGSTVSMLNSDLPRFLPLITPHPR
jgi:hypothetical protein